MNFIKFLAKIWIFLAILVLILTSNQVEGQYRRRPGSRRPGSTRPYGPLSRGYGGGNRGYGSYGRYRGYGYGR
jgi:uncharacterized membrane protein